MLQFLEKVEKSPQRWGHVETLKLFVTPTQYKCDFRVLLKFLGIVKITTCYLIVTVSGPLNHKLASPPWLKLLVTPLIMSIF